MVLIRKSISSLKTEFSSQDMFIWIENFFFIYEDSLKRVLIIPPDFTRYHSKSGDITQILYKFFNNKAEVLILPALGTHSPLTSSERKMMYGNIPKENFIEHNWRNDVIKVGSVPADYIKEISEDKLEYSINIEINKHILENFDLIISIGQVVPHEVAGMANGYKNILVGVGGSDMINKSHFLSACFGIERIMGKIDTPVRKLFNYAFESFLGDLPVVFVQTVLEQDNSGKISLRGLFGGEKQRPFNEAAKLSQKLNITMLDTSLEKIVVFLDTEEYKSTWLGNKAIYRTRMVIKNGGELLVLAPGLKRFGEDEAIDQLIRKYGYRTSSEILNAVKTNQDLQQNLSAAAHLIHGSSDDRFKIIYGVNNITKKEIEGVNYQYCDLSRVIDLYNPLSLTEGYNQLSNGEEIFFIRNPALGLWTTIDRFKHEV